ncbi:signal peptidase II Aspartic peptidase. MEROPS family A08 [Pseudomonas pohangensis]|jgi:signal peptidase II|uniref:Lipoprotein signal peptidase n=1 Tax=Pseudomonas pohangensis TaxID=364197 RepID=A0A1H2E3G9_9PSED|nr:signal peptidase II [Pseudomonas pohangensis]SDT89613.1 signal peptidase II Aspartic peptidase. MEROPS family A08 [Pseudomonas pohangensis]
MSARFGKLGWLWLSVLVIVLDQVSKLYFENALGLYQQIVVIPDYFSWTLAYNTGAAFSFLADAAGWQRWFFAVVALAVSIMLVIWMKGLKQHENWLAIALALVLGGALGNLFDRMVYGHVIDFILVHWQQRWYFPAFNLADSAITAGAVMLALDMFRGKPSKEAEV